MSKFRPEIRKTEDGKFLALVRDTERGITFRFLPLVDFYWRSSAKICAEAYAEAANIAGGLYRTAIVVQEPAPPPGLMQVLIRYRSGNCITVSFDPEDVTLARVPEIMALNPEIEAVEIERFLHAVP